MDQVDKILAEADKDPVFMQLISDINELNVASEKLYSLGCSPNEDIVFDGMNVTNVCKTVNGGTRIIDSVILTKLRSVLERYIDESVDFIPKE